jgi:hypothetical protein
MPCDTHGPFPFAVVRDLLGITRALYRAERDADSPDSHERLRALVEAGKAYRQALDLAMESEPGTLGRRAAWSWAEKATDKLGRVVGSRSELSALIEVSAACLGRRRKPPTR